MTKFNVKTTTMSRVGKFKLSVIGLLIVSMTMGALMIAVLRGNAATHVLDKIDNPSVEQSVVQVDFGQLAHKYYEYLVVNDNGTLSLELHQQYARSVQQEIDIEDLTTLEEYVEMLDKLNALVVEGTMYIAEDGQYYMSDTQDGVGTRGWSGGVNNFSVRSQKVWFVWVPVGYTWKMQTSAAIIFGIVTRMVAYTMSFVNSLVNSTSETKNFVRTLILETVKGVGSTAIDAFFLAMNWDLIATVVSAFKLSWDIGKSMNVTGAGAVVSVVLALVSGYIWDNIGMPFLVQGINNLNNDNNTSVMESDLIFWGNNTYGIRA